MVIKNTYFGQDDLFPTQLELFSGMINRKEFPIDVSAISLDSAPISSTVQSAMDGIVRQLHNLSIT